MRDAFMILTMIRPGVQLEDNAAQSFVRMSDAADIELMVNSAYRDAVLQQKLYDGFQAHKPGFNFALPPAQSSHCRGTAIDFYKEDYGWLERHANEYGWYRTDKNERWHYEYFANRDLHVHTVVPANVNVVEDEPMNLTILVNDQGPATAPEYGSVAVIDPVNGFTQVSVNLGPRDELSARTALANLLGWKITQKNVDSNAFAMARAQYTKR